MEGEPEHATNSPMFNGDRLLGLLNQPTIDLFAFQGIEDLKQELAAWEVRSVSKCFLRDRVFFI